jgi:hypothetical protein
LAARARIGDFRLFDVHHGDLITDPMATMSSIYKFSGLELSAQVEESCSDWQRANRSGAHGSHSYSPDQFGLGIAQLRSEYDFYIRHFDVELEG